MNRRTLALISVASVALGACDTDDVDTNTDAAEVGSDTGDVSNDAADAGVDADSDAQADTGVDAQIDAEDTTEIDGGADTETDAESDTHEEVHFEYEGENGPEHWGTLSEEWATCGSGSAQSPINLSSGVAPAWHPALVFEYGQTAPTITHRGHTIEVEVEDGTSTLEIGDERWNLKQFHFHTVSEHTIDGEHAPLEMHMVHYNELGELAVIGVFVLPGLEEDMPADDPFAFLLQHAPLSEGPAIEPEGLLINPADIFSASAAYWHYDGSLTTPPCSEGVSWYLLAEPTITSPDFVNLIETAVGPSARPTQPLNDRTIEGAHWSYEGEESGPEMWSELSPFFSQCGEGTEQSPIDIPAETAATEVSILFDYPSVALSMENNGHTVEVEVADGSTVTIEGEIWELAQFHFHAGSEHTIDGDRSVGEVHFVHRNEIGQLAVLGARLEVDDTAEDSGPFTSILMNLPNEPHSTFTDETTDIDPRALLPDSSVMWRYDGSLTTPPCTEGVSWHLFAIPMMIPVAQATALEEVLGGTYRPTQPLNAREIE